ncbi:Amidase domain-containing protein [Mycena venus]|uniref:Amidase domain-containing protein n=1 Tax=Mycena venus TaxID=2733690 RepID=A0A8H6Z692_9AGAR|nr:Amidase domain-containing protein [Mycena venus]
MPFHPTVNCAATLAAKRAPYGKTRILFHAKNAVTGLILTASDPLPTRIPIPMLNLNSAGTTLSLFSCAPSVSSEMIPRNATRASAGQEKSIGTDRERSNAYFPHADPCGSSSGSGIAASIGLAAVTLGTETDGSITCPTSNNNLAGIKPTVGLTSRAGVIPISAHQDTVGPMTRSLTDAAIVLSVIAGKDPKDNFTLAQPPVVPDFTKALNKNALKGKRFGVPRHVFLTDSITGNDPSINVAYEKALLPIKALGATVVDPADLPSTDEFVTSNNETIVLNVDFKVQLWTNKVRK